MIEQGVGYCEYHDDEVSLNTFLWKGCWGCHYFEERDSFPYYDVAQASDILGVSESTVRRWIKKHKLDGFLARQGRSSFHLHSPRKYFIKKKSVEKLRDDME